jgi:hypothetical protein
MQNGPKTLMSWRQPKPAASFAARSMRWTPHSLAVVAGNDAEAVMLDLMQPLATGRQLSGFGREARRDEPGRHLRDHSCPEGSRFNPQWPVLGDRVAGSGQYRRPGAGLF